jgi:hypothetical protein
MSEEIKIKGTIKILGDTQEVGSKGFIKREMVLTTLDEKYPQDLKIEFLKDNCSKLDAFSLGDEVTVSVNLKGSEWNGKYFVSLTGWKIESASPF